MRGNVLKFLNENLRKVTLETTITNAEQNLCQPVLYYLGTQKDADESLIQDELQQSERDGTRRLTAEHVSQRTKELGDSLRNIRDQVANARPTMFTDQSQSKELEETLRQEIKRGDRTDAY